MLTGNRNMKAGLKISVASGCVPITLASYLTSDNFDHCVLRSAFRSHCLLAFQPVSLLLSPSPKPVSFSYLPTPSNLPLFETQHIYICRYSAIIILSPCRISRYIVTSLAELSTSRLAAGVPPACVSIPCDTQLGQWWLSGLSKRSIKWLPARMPCQSHVYNVSKLIYSKPGRDLTQLEVRRTAAGGTLKN